MLRQFIALLLGLLSLWASAQERVRVISQYEYPPFVVKNPDGLTQDLVRLLNQHAAGHYQFELEFIPRARIDLILSENPANVIVPWVNPLWFKDADKTRFYWSQPLIQDADLVLMNRRRSFDYKGVDSLAGKILGGVTGHNYPELTPLLDTRQLRRDDAPNEISNLQKLALGRVDFIYLPARATSYLLDYYQLEDAIVAAPLPRNEYTRHLLISHSSDKLYRFLQQNLPALLASPEWQQIRKRYRLAGIGLE